MMRCPIGGHLCASVQHESIRIWNDLLDAEVLDSPFHEDTVTQTLALNLTRQCLGSTRIYQFNRHEEKQNGSDFLWYARDRRRNRFFFAAIQAKRLYRDGKYAAFKKRQASKLIQYARNMRIAAPLYLFYNYPTQSILNRDLIRTNAWPWLSLRSDYARNLGLAYVDANQIQGLCASSNTLSFKMVASCVQSMWVPFCLCFALDGPVHLFDSNLWKPMDFDSGERQRELLRLLDAWLAGEEFPGTLRESLLPSRIDDEDGFFPSHVLAIEV